MVNDMSTFYFGRLKRQPMGFPAGFSRVVIRLAQGRGAKPNANTRKPNPHKCLVVPSLSPRLRPVCPRNIGANAATTRAGLAPFVDAYRFTPIHASERPQGK